MRESWLLPNDYMIQPLCLPNKDVALGNELKGKAVLADGDVDDATHHLGLAARFYKEWGSPAKAAQLADEFPTMFKPPARVTMDH